MKLSAGLAQRFGRSAACTILAMSAFSATGLGAHAFEITKPKGVVELFTSQGCSSCPPADEALKAMNAQGEILGLALHVDYWDRLGWKDTFGSSENTERQWRYARSLGERQVYTPQAVINGRTHVVGSQRVKILDTVYGFAENKEGLSVDINVQKINDVIKIAIPKGTTAQNATLYTFYFNPEGEVAIKRGENAGKTIHYTNIVGKVEMIGMVGDNGLTTEFAVADIRQKGFKSCAMILQAKAADGGPGPIIGATVMSDL